MLLYTTSELYKFLTKPEVAFCHVHGQLLILWMFCMQKQANTTKYVNRVPKDVPVYEIKVAL